MENPGVLQARLAALRFALRAAMVSVGLGRLLCLAAVAVLSDAALDRALRLPWGARLALSGGLGALIAFEAVRWFLRPLVRALPDEALALEVEARWSGPPDLAASAVYLCGGKGGAATSGALRALVAQEADGRGSLIVPGALVRWGLLWRWLLAAAGCVGALAVLSQVAPHAAEVWFRRNVLLSALEWPRRTRLSLIAAPRHVARGEPLSVAVRADGVVPRAAELRLRGARSRAARSVEMERVGQRLFRARLRGLEETSLFAVRAGDGRTEERRINVVDRPSVAEARMEVRPPAYISPDPVELAWNAPVFRIPEGSEATVTITA
ncbi:MAG: hypothetical protein ACYS8K_04810, partial [Planctomycetota bacterium]